MERWGAGWRTRTWARWLGWTLLYTLVTYGIGILGSWMFMALELGPTRMDIQGWILLAPPFLLALLIGIWFRSWWWLLGPPVALLLPSFVGLLIIPDLPSDAGQGYLLFLFLAVVSFIPSLVGIAIGKVWMRVGRPVRRS